MYVAPFLSSLSFLHAAAPEPGLINGGLVPHVSYIGHCTLCILYRTLHPVHPLLSARGRGPLSRCPTVPQQGHPHGSDSELGGRELWEPYFFSTLTFGSFFSRVG